MKTLRRIHKGIDGALAIVKASFRSLDFTSADSVIVNIRCPIRTTTLKQILTLFHVAGYRTYMRICSIHDALILASSLLEFEDAKITWRRPSSRIAPVLCTDSEIGCDVEQFRKVVTISYDYRPGLSAGDGDFIMPFTMHSTLYTKYEADEQLREYRDLGRRKVRVLFSGLYGEGYDDPIVRDLYGLPTRREIIDFIVSRNLAKVATSWEELESIYEGDYWDGLVLVDTNRAWIPKRYWLGILARTDFFLCPPGKIMPMCYNSVEAMAVGTIPLTCYPDWFLPNLSHMRDCVVFRSLDGLVESLQKVSRLSADQLSTLRRGVEDYYDRNLSLEEFSRRLLAYPDKRARLHVLHGSEDSLRSLFVLNESKQL